MTYFVFPKMARLFHFRQIPQRHQDNKRWGETTTSRTAREPPQPSFSRFFQAFCWVGFPFRVIRKDQNCLKQLPAYSPHPPTHPRPCPPLRFVCTNRIGDSNSRRRMVDQSPSLEVIQCPSWASSLGYMGVAAAVCLSNWGSAVRCPEIEKGCCAIALEMEKALWVNWVCASARFLG